MEKEIKEILAIHPDYEICHVMNTLFERMIPTGEIYRVSRIVKACSKLTK